jgi:predicted ArsR family transcriptional regulator
MATRAENVKRLASLQDPVRRRLHEYVRARGEPVGREEAGEAVGIGRSLAAYHLDRLTDEGLLTATYRRPEGRTGPGAGRPAKLYEPAEGEVAVSVPARDYEFAAHVLAEAADADPSGNARTSLDHVARDQGRELGNALAAPARTTGLEQALRERGYEPFLDEDGVIRLRNCPFHRLAAEHRDLVCGMNLSFLEGLLEGLGREDLEGSLEPAPGQCCVAIRTR